ARLRRERIRHDRAAVPVDVNEALARENSKCFGGVDPESCHGGAGRFFARRSRGCELAQDPEVELMLRRREATSPRRALPLRANVGRAQRVERERVAIDGHRWSPFMPFLTRYAR